MSHGARNWPFLTLTGLPVRPAASKRSVWRQRNAGVCNTSTTSATGAHCSGAWMSVSTGQTRRFAHFGEDRQPVLQPDAARRAERGAVGLVERGLVDQADPQFARDFGQCRAGFQRMGAQLERIRADDEHQRQVVTERQIADRNVAWWHPEAPVAGCPSPASLSLGTLSPQAERGFWSAAREAAQ